VTRGALEVHYAHHTEREKFVPARASVPDDAPVEIQKHEMIYPLAIRYVIRAVREGWVELKALRQERDSDIILERTEEFASKMAIAVDRLTYGSIVGALAGEFHMAKETAYSWASVMKNSWNGFLVERDLPEGRLLDFADPEYHRMSIEEVYARHPATGRHGTRWGVNLAPD
jgi:hypothetical protein